jgi:transcriptional regulator with XRE-family HTH domain
MAEYCRKTGLSRRTIENYVAGSSLPDLKMISGILGGLDCDPVWLVFGDVELGGLVMERGISYNASAALTEAERRMREAAEALAKARKELEHDGLK